MSAYFGEYMSLFRVLYTSVDTSWKVPLTVLVNIPRVEYCGETIGPYSPGDNVELPRYVADMLLKGNLAKVNTKKLPTSIELSKLLWIEERSEQLQKLDEDFLHRVKLYLKSLEQLARESTSVNPILLAQEAQHVKIKVLDLMKRRLVKIVKIALSNPNPRQEVLEKLTIEERMLYVKLCRELGSWLSFLENEFK